MTLDRDYAAADAAPEQQDMIGSYSHPAIPDAKLFETAFFPTKIVRRQDVLEEVVMYEFDKYFDALKFRERLDSGIVEKKIYAGYRFNGKAEPYFSIVQRMPRDYKS